MVKDEQNWSVMIVLRKKHIREKFRQNFCKLNTKIYWQTSHKEINKPTHR